MKVISLLQPWASLVVIGAKKIETRSWNTKYRGDLLIHASAGKKGLSLLKKNPDAELNEFVAAAGFKKFDEFPLGEIIGKVKLTETASIEKIICETKEYSLTDQEEAFGDYTPFANRYGWILKDPVEFDKPIPAKGMLGLWNFPMCKICGCWDEDACIHPDHGNCSWAEPDLCSHCKDYPGQAKRYSQIIHQ